MLTPSIILIFLALLFSCITSSEYFVFQKFNQASKPTLIYIYAERGAYLDIYVQFSQKQKFMKGYFGDIYDLGFNFGPFFRNQSNYLAIKQLDKPISSSTIPFFTTIIQKKEVSIYSFFVEFNGSTQFLVKITVKINSTLIRVHYELVTQDIISTNINPFPIGSKFNFPTFEFEIYSACQIFIEGYLMWLQRSRESLYFYSPFRDIFHIFDNRGGTANLSLNLTIPGKWRIKIVPNEERELYFYDRQLTIKTSNISTCFHPCSKYPYPVIGLAPGTQDTCMCNPYEKPFVVWNCKKKQCVSYGLKSSCGFCGNNVLQKGQQCEPGENGENEGCTSGCVPKPGYNCTLNTVNLTSSCILNKKQDFKWEIYAALLLFLVALITGCFFCIKKCVQLSQRQSRRVPHSVSIRQLREMNT